MKPMKLPSKACIAEMGKVLDEMVPETEGLGPPDPELLRDCGDGVVRTILTYPNSRLWDETTEVSFGEGLRKLVADLAMTMYAVGGVGLAAPQIGEQDRVFVVDIWNGAPGQRGRPPSQLLVVVNPILWCIPGKERRDSERCLSFPDVVENVTRPTHIILKAYNHRGKPYALGCGGDLARAIQHEYDHLEGVLLIDHLSKTRARELRQRLRLRSLDR